MRLNIARPAQKYQASYRLLGREGPGLRMDFPHVPDRDPHLFVAKHFIIVRSRHPMSARITLGTTVPARFAAGLTWARPWQKPFSSNSCLFCSSSYRSTSDRALLARLSRSPVIFNGHPTRIAGLPKRYIRHASSIGSPLTSPGLLYLDSICVTEGRLFI